MSWGTRAGETGHLLSRTRQAAWTAVVVSAALIGAIAWVASHRFPIAGQRRVERSLMA